MGNITLSASSDDADTRMLVNDDGFDPSSKIRRPDAVAPFDVTITTFERSSPPTVIGSEPVSASAPLSPPTRAVNIMLSPLPLVMNCIERVCNVYSPGARFGIVKLPFLSLRALPPIIIIMPPASPLRGNALIIDPSTGFPSELMTVPVILTSFTGRSAKSVFCAS
jgi:hypothetical protein